MRGLLAELTALQTPSKITEAKCVRCHCVTVPKTHERANIRRTVLDLLSNSRGEMAEWSMAVVLKAVQGWEGPQLLPIHPNRIRRF